MITEDQSSVVDFLSSPATYGGTPVERIDTHASRVFLAGERAWKLKRAVRYDYLDYSTVNRRRAMCEEEVRINRRTAPRLYRGVSAVTRQADGQLAIGGNGVPVEWLVEMTRFDQSALFDRLAEAGQLPLTFMGPLAHAIASFHQAADSRTHEGGWEAMRRVIDGNDIGFSTEADGVLDPTACAALTDRARYALGRCCGVLDDRRDDGHVRHCHGDLHLRNIVLLDGRPTLFDAIEFNDDFSSIDVLYDLAFLLMDLWRLHLPHHANFLWNSYLGETVDLGGLSSMPLFLSCRAAVAAKTTATSARLQLRPDRRRQWHARANEYLALATDLLDPPAPRLIAIGGFSGAGKSTLARMLAPLLGAAPGAVIIRSDVIRKKLCGVDPLARLGPEGYSDQVSRRVYATALKQADMVVRGGYTAIVDAVFADGAERDAIERQSHVAGVRFSGVWLDAPVDILRARVEGRGPDPSDANAAVIDRQLRCRRESVLWRHVDSSRTSQQVCDTVAARVGARQDTRPARHPSFPAVTC